MAENQAYCAHLKVVYKRIDNPNGTCSDSWVCASDCKTQFAPRGNDSRDQEVAELTKELAELDGMEKSYAAQVAELKDAYALVVRQISSLHEFMLYNFKGAYTLTDKPVEAMPRLMLKLKARAEKAESDRDEARAACGDKDDALEKYGHHAEECSSFIPLPTGDPHYWGCDCGYDEACHKPNPGALLLEELRALREVLTVFLGVVHGSRGVDGWHRNGDVAQWDEFDFIEEAEALAEKVPVAGVKP